MRHKLVSCAIAACGLSVAGIASGGEVVDLSIELDGWTLVPVSSDGAMSAIIAVRDEDEISTPISMSCCMNGWARIGSDPLMHRVLRWKTR